MTDKRNKPKAPDNPIPNLGHEQVAAPDVAPPPAVRAIPLDHQILIACRGGNNSPVANLPGRLEFPAGIAEGEQMTLVLEAIRGLILRGLILLPGGKTEAPHPQDWVRVPELPSDERFVEDSRLDVLPPASESENLALERLLVLEGCREPVLVCRLPDRSEPVLLDGRRRVLACRRHGIAYEVREVEMAGLREAQDWLWENHFGRRSYTPEAIAYVVGRAYLARVGPRGGRRPNHQSDGSNVDHKAASWVAARYSVGQATVERDAVYARALDDIAEAAGEQARKDILGRRVRLTRDDVSMLAGCETDKVQGVLEALRKNSRKELAALRSTKTKKTQPKSVALTVKGTPALWADTILKEFGKAKAKALAEELARKVEPRQRAATTTPTSDPAGAGEQRGG